MEDNDKGTSKNDVTARGGGLLNSTNSTKTILLKSVTMGGGVSKIIENCVASFMDDP
jgi:hypothetical protein